MDLVEVEKLLQSYNIQSLEELEFYLDIDNAKDECIDDPEEEKNCINAKCYEDVTVPDCRKIIEIYNKYFKNNIKSKKLFIQYLSDHIKKSPSSIENYLSCKSCNQQMAKSIHNSLKIADADFKKDFCSNLKKKFNYLTLFETDYFSIKQFLLKEHEITKESFKVEFTQGQEALTSEEEAKIFDLTLVSKDELKKNLLDADNIRGSNSYKMNLALAAFNRNLIEESSKIIETLSNEETFQNSKELLQLKAKILSIQKQDKEAIVLLTKLIDMTNPNIDAETNNLLAASIKREAFTEFERYSDEEQLVNKLSHAKEMYFSVFKLNNDYYPALNYMYLESMLQYIENADKAKINKMRNDFELIWDSLNHKVNDWWSYISNIEYLILRGEYKEVVPELKKHFHTIDEFEINDFNLISTIRQLELYSNFCADSELKDIIKLLREYFPE